MSRIHDMGGRFGDGPVDPDPGEPLFKEDWHRKALALTLACASFGQWNLDVSRHARERLRPQDYGRFSYYEKWVAALTNLLVETGVLHEDELRKGGAIGESPFADRKLEASAVPGVLAKGAPAERKSDVPVLFQPGAKVRTRRAQNPEVAGGHTRLPGYAAQSEGTVVRLHGTHILPDSNGHRQGEAPEPLYAVAFRAADLWQSPEHPGDEVILDLWQSYLEPA